jgi:hypothetical protein
MSRHPGRPASAALGVLLALVVADARGQDAPHGGSGPYPRSGLLSRFIPVIPHLPTDPDRDKFYDTYWDDDPFKAAHPNSCKHGGLYGLRLKADCTKCYSPYFLGEPGRSTAGPHCDPGHRGARIITNFFHPFRPVCHYYAGGCYVPVYDLDPLVTGPGPFPWHVFFKRHNGG